MDFFRLLSKKVKENGKLLVDEPRNRSGSFLKTAVFCAIARATGSDLQNRWKTDLVAKSLNN